MTSERGKEIIDKFLDGEGPPKFFAYYQTPDMGGENEHLAADPVLFFTYGDTEKIKDKAVWFLRNLPENKKSVNTSEANNEEVLWGEITPNPVKILNHMMEMVYDPMLSSEKNTDWGVSEVEAKKEFLGLTERFKKEVKEAIDLMTPKLENFKLDPEELARYENAPDSEKIPFFEQKFEYWIKNIENFFNEEKPNKSNEETDPGPKTELEYWRSRMQEITNWSEQLKSKDFNLVKNTLTRHKQH
jgi:dynein heavy chain